MLNWSVPEAWLAARLPQGCALDPFQGEHVVSLVGFRFEDTRVRGVRIPGHHTFEEVNLRFYVVRRAPDGEVRRGVVFVRELVPRAAIAVVARLAYDEPYKTAKMWNDVALDAETGGHARYGWTFGGARAELAGEVSGPAEESAPGSEAEFITEHYWGYTKRKRGATSEYEVRHPRWRVWDVPGARFEGDTRALYGADFAGLLATAPRSAFLAVGSEVEVFPGARLGAEN